LQDMEYLIVHRGGRGQSFVYELFFEANEDTARPTLPRLEREYDGNRSGLEEHRSGGSLAQVWGMSGSGLVDKSPVSMQAPSPLATHLPKNTSAEEIEHNGIVGVPRSMNGNNGHHRGGTTWPA
jgi:hypothetical protein